MLLSKTDLVSDVQVDAVSQRLRQINPRAELVAAQFGRVPLKELLDIRGFNLNEVLRIAPEFLSAGHHHHAKDRVRNNFV